MNRTSIVTAITGLVFAGVLASSTPAQDPGTRVAPQQPRVEGGRHVRRLGRALQLDRAQQQQALEVARSAQALRRENFQKLLPQVRALIAGLTPEQRARIEAFAARHGRALDEARLERRLALLLSRPGAARRIERHLAR